MTVTWIDTPNVPLASRSDAIDFTVTGGAGGAAPTSPVITPGSLQPLNLAPVGAWALGDAEGLTAADRSGAGHFLYNWGSRGPSPVADPLGGFAMGPGMRYPLSSVAATATLQITGPLTITLRVRVTSSASEMILVQCAAQNEAEADNILYELSVTATTLTPMYRAEYGAGQDMHTTSNTSHNLSLNTWHFLALRRDAAGTLTFNVDARPSATVGGFILPTGGTNANVFLGGGISALQYNDQGRLLKDVMIWNKRLTDAEIETQRLGMGTLA